MTNGLLVMVFVSWLTNTVDVPLTPDGFNLLRSQIISQTHIYTVPGFPTVTNTVAVATNTSRFVLQLMELPMTNSLPPLPK